VIGVTWFKVKMKRRWWSSCMGTGGVANRTSSWNVSLLLGFTLHLFWKLF